MEQIINPLHFAQSNLIANKFYIYNVTTNILTPNKYLVFIEIIVTYTHKTYRFHKKREQVLPALILQYPTK